MAHPKYDEAMAVTTIRISEKHREVLKQVGGENVSEGVRRLVDEYLKRREDKVKA